MASKFEKFFNSPCFPINIRKVPEFQRIISKALRVIDKNLWGVLKEPPGLNRVENENLMLSKTESLCINMCQRSTHQVNVSRKGVLSASDSIKFFETPCILTITEVPNLLGKHSLLQTEFAAQFLSLVSI